jgi:hypothetical protein
MQARDNKSLDVIGDGLRNVWRDVVASPMPERIGRLLEELRRREREVAAQQHAQRHRRHASHEG